MSLGNPDSLTINFIDGLRLPGVADIAVINLHEDVTEGEALCADPADVNPPLGSSSVLASYFHS